MSTVVSSLDRVSNVPTRRSYSTSHATTPLSSHYQQQRSGVLNTPTILKEDSVSAYNNNNNNNNLNDGSNYNPFAFSNGEIVQNHSQSANISPVFTITSVQSTPTYKQQQLQGSHYENDAGNGEYHHQEYVTAAKQHHNQHQSVRKQFIRSGGQSATRKHYKIQKDTPCTQVNY